MKRTFLISVLFFLIFSPYSFSAPIDTTGLTPLLNWPDIPGATQYRLQIATNTNFNSPVLDVTIIQSQYQVLSGLLLCNTVYYWRYSGFIGGSWGSWSATYQFFTYCPIGIGDPEGNLPKYFKLYQNYPNPFNPATIIKFDIPSNSFVSLGVYDIIGNEILVLVKSELTPGTYELTFDGSNLASGIYYYKLVSGEFSSVRRMILIK